MNPTMENFCGAASFFDALSTYLFYIMVNPVLY